MNIAFIGAVGVPNVYGGFEMFLEACGPGFAGHFDEVFVSCDKNRYADRAPIWMGVRRVFIPLRANGVQSIIHDLLAFFVVFFRVKVIVVLGVSGGIFFPIFRLLCAFTGKRVIVNVDGLEFRRQKFSTAKQRFLYWSDRLAQRFAHRVVIDNEALRPHLDSFVQSSAVLITYPGDHVLRGSLNRNALTLGCQYLTICRIEPENQCHLLLESFARVGAGIYVFVGNWDSSDYGRKLRNQYRDVPGLQLREPVYDKTILANLREGCDCYLHGHSVGGTNPSLVEMLFYDCKIMAFDCAFNRNTAGDTIGYFTSSDELVARLKSIKESKQMNRAFIRDRYTRNRICNDYINLIEEAIK
jgi:glycosyltransferase involved in cell wall biosynthesis